MKIIKLNIFELCKAPSFILLGKFYVFKPNLPKEGYFRPKRGNLNINIEFSLFKLIYLPYFLLKKLRFSGTNLPKKGISSLKQNK